MTTKMIGHINEVLYNEMYIYIIYIMYIIYIIYIYIYVYI